SVEHCPHTAEVGGSIPSHANQICGNRLGCFAGTCSTRTRHQATRVRPSTFSADQRYVEERADPALAIWPSPTVLRPASQRWSLTWDRIRPGRRVMISLASRHSDIHCPGNCRRLSVSSLIALIARLPRTFTLS